MSIWLVYWNYIPSANSITKTNISGAPVYLSNPHFFQADPSLLADVEGLKPNRSLHQTFFKIQPVRH